MKKTLMVAALLILAAFAIPFEHKYDKVFRFFSLTLIPEGLSIGPYFEKKIYFYPSDFLALFLLITGLFWFRRHLFTSPLWIVFLCALGSIIASPFIGYPVAYTRLLQLLTPIAFFSFLANWPNLKLTQAICFALFSAALIQAGVGIAQYFHEGPLGLRILGEPTSFAEVFISDKTRWALDYFFSPELSTYNKIRATGTLPHANVLGGFLALSLLLTYGFTLQFPKKRVLFALTIPWQFFALCLTYSRSALFAWCLGTGLWFALMLFKKKERKFTFLTSWIALAVALSALLLFPQMRERGGIVNYNTTAQGSDEIRLYQQNVATNIIRDHPCLGVGYGQFSERAQPYYPPETDAYRRSTGPHNIYLFLACETGLISLGAFLLFIFLILRGTWRSAMTTETATLTACFCALLFIGCCDFYPILFQQGKLLFFILSGSLVACQRAEKVVKYSSYAKSAAT